jgi:lipid II isoglutaminyl synthase (glutamine-hydrolysing)
MERLDTQFVARSLSSLPYGVVIISGTNGKTTTTKMVVQLLRAAGLTVFTNPTGSNFVRGVAAALLHEVDSRGVLHADIAVLELDEAHAVHFVKQVAPRHVLLLNVMRDQLDRFGEIDHTSELLATVAKAATEGVVLNRDDPLVSAIGATLAVPTRHFGLSSELRSQFPNDQELYATASNPSRTPSIDPHDVTLTKLREHEAVFAIGTTKQKPSHLKIDGIYNVLNAAAALCLSRMILGTGHDARLLKELDAVTPAFGRGETIMVDGQPLEIVLVKNPAGFRLALASYKDSPAQTLVAINDNYADGRDMSWLWDVDFSSLTSVAPVTTSGVRAYDMALRLQYDEIEVGLVEPSIPRSMATFTASSRGPMRIYCTYTAMLAIRRWLATHHTVEAAL